MATRDRVVVSSAAQAAAVVDSIASLGVDMMKARDFADVATYWAIAGSARRVGLPFVGHAPFGLSVDAIALADSGQNDLEHWYFPTDLPTLPAAQYEKIVTEYVRNGTALAPTLTAWRQHRFTVDSLEKLLAAANRDPRAVRAPASLFRHWKSQLDPRRTENKGKPYTAQQLAGWNRVLDEYARETGKLARKGMMILAGSDLPFARYPGEGLQDELVALVNEAGVTPAQALQTATVIPARFLKLESVGKIEPGMDADLVVLDANPFVDIANIRRVRAVMKGGRWAPPGIVKGCGAR